MLNKLKVMGGPTLIYTPLGTYGGFYVCIDQKSLLKSFIIDNELGVN